MLLFFFVCLLQFAACSSQNKGTAVVKIGNVTITKKDVELRNKVIKIYNPREKRDLGLLQLQNAYTRLAVLKQNNRNISQAMLAAEVKRIDTSTLLPEVLKKIKDIFAGDMESYKKIYVLPLMVDRIIYYQFFLRDPSVQAESLRPVQVFLDKVVKSKKELSILARENKLDYSKFQLTEKSGIEWFVEKKPEKRVSQKSNMPVEVMRKFSQKKKTERVKEGRRWIETVIKGTKSGDYFNRAVDYHDKWMVVRYIRKRPKKEIYDLEAVFFPKVSFDKWLTSQSKNIDIKFF